MRKIILNLAVSLDGFIEGPHGDYGWCFTDQDYGMSEFLKRVDTIFLGRKSYDVLAQDPGPFSAMPWYVFSTTMTSALPNSTIVSDNLEPEVQRIRRLPGKDIWLFGGAGLTTAFINLDLVDELQLAVHPLLLGAGKPLFQNLSHAIPWTLTNTLSYSSGLVQLFYARRGMTISAG